MKTQRTHYALEENVFLKHLQEMRSERDRKLEAAQKQRQIRHQQVT